MELETWSERWNERKTESERWNERLGVRDGMKRLRDGMREME